MENDPNKKESKGKRIFKKAVRRNSKSSNIGQGSALEHQGIGGTRSRSLEGPGGALETSVSVPLPKPDGTNSPQQGITSATVRSDIKWRKIEIRESHNETIAETPHLDSKELLLRAPNNTSLSSQDGVKRNLKRVGYDL